MRRRRLWRLMLRRAPSERRRGQSAGTVLQRLPCRRQDSPITGQRNTKAAGLCTTVTGTEAYEGRTEAGLAARLVPPWRDLLSSPSFGGGH